jgi:succinyl-diaminopimelate desuccinylase
LLSLYPDLSGAYIGYPDSANIKVGARGFLRAQIVFRGIAAHTGARSLTKENAIAKAMFFLHKLQVAGESFNIDSEFGLPPKATATSIVGGRGYSIVPDRCKIRIDVRLTPKNDRRWAEQLIFGILAEVDKAGGIENRSTVRFERGWPAYHVTDGTSIIYALRENAEKSLGRPVHFEVSGPSNVGNMLAAFDVPATCGFGVDCGGVHGYDEYMEINSLVPIYNAYHGALSHLFMGRRTL